MAFIPPPSTPPGSSGPFSSRPFPRPRKLQETANSDEHRINERIRVPQVRLIDEKGGQVGVIATSEALKMARERGLDLMEVSPNSNPPVCKICDYGKFKYEKKKKEQIAKKKQTVIKVKEVQLRPQTDEHDLTYKIKNIRTFLEEGDKAKVTMLFRGREIAHTEGGRQMLMDVIKRLEDIAMVEASPKLDGKKMIMILAPSGDAKKTKKPAQPTAKIIISKPET